MHRSLASAAPASSSRAPAPKSPASGAAANLRPGDGPPPLRAAASSSAEGSRCGDVRSASRPGVLLPCRPERLSERLSVWLSERPIERLELRVSGGSGGLSTCALIQQHICRTNTYINRRVALP